MSEPRSILVVEDEEHLAQGIAENLEAEGYRVSIVGEGRAALATIRRGGHDLILLDVMLPGLDGFSICETARAEGLQTPVLFLTAKSSVDDRVQGLEAGGDDYLPKPFHLQELLARVKVILRRWSWYERATQSSAQVLRFVGYRIAAEQEKTGIAPTLLAQMAKLSAMELNQRVTNMTMGVRGMHSQGHRAGAAGASADRSHRRPGAAA